MKGERHDYKGCEDKLGLARKRQAERLLLPGLNFVLNAGSVETVYIPEKDSYQMKGLKRETYRA